MINIIFNILFVFFYANILSTPSTFTNSKLLFKRHLSPFPYHVRKERFKWDSTTHSICNEHCTCTFMTTVLTLFNCLIHFKKLWHKWKRRSIDYRCKYWSPLKGGEWLCFGNLLNGMVKLKPTQRGEWCVLATY